MLSPVEMKSRATSNSDYDARASQLAELRAELATIATEFGKLVEARSAKAKEFVIDEATAGMNATRSAIRAQPMASLAIALVIGAAMAVLIVPKGASRRPTRNRDWSFDATRAELNGALDRARHAMPDVNSRSLMSSLERMVDSLSSIDAKSALMPTWEKIAPWFQSLYGPSNGK